MTLVFALLLTPLLFLNLVFAVETAVGLKRGGKRGQPAERTSTVIVVPAHNEAAVLENTLQRLSAVTDADFKVLVVADNCTDDTADIARRVGVQVVERDDPALRGKGHALAFAREAMRPRPPSVVIVLDADCHIDGPSLTALAGASQNSGKPGQAINLLEPQNAAAPMVQISTFAFLLKNLVRQRGLQRLTGGVHLTGTGMALPWHLFEKADLATSSIVEDVRLGLELSQSGMRPQLIENAIVWSPPSDTAGTYTQRRRWEGGFLAMARGAAPQAILSGMRRFDLKAVISGFDLLVPPLAMLVLLDVAALAIMVAAACLELSSWQPPTALGIALMTVAILILAVWWREGRGFLTPQALLRLPLYVLWKLPLYLGFAARGAPSEWLQSGRPSRTD